MGRARRRLDGAALAEWNAQHPRGPDGRFIRANSVQGLVGSARARLGLTRPAIPATPTPRPASPTANGRREPQPRKRAAARLKPPAPKAEAPISADEQAAGSVEKVSIGDLLATGPRSQRRIGETARDLLKQRLEGTYAGLRVEIHEVDVQRDELTFRARIRDADGVGVGTIERQLFRDRDGTLHAYHALLSIDRSHQGQGFAQAWNDHLYAWYRESGLSYVKVTANIDVGGYTWARQGFDFADEHAAATIRRRLRAFLEGQGGSLRPEQVLTAEAMLKRLDGTFGSPGYPTAYEVSQTGRLPGQNKRNDVWPGRAAMLGSFWSGIKWL